MHLYKPWQGWTNLFPFKIIKNKLAWRQLKKELGQDPKDQCRSFFFPNTRRLQCKRDAGHTEEHLCRSEINTDIVYQWDESDIEAAAYIPIAPPLPEFNSPQAVLEWLEKDG